MPHIGLQRNQLTIYPPLIICVRSITARTDESVTTALVEAALSSALTRQKHSRGEREVDPTLLSSFSNELTGVTVVTIFFENVMAPHNRSSIGKGTENISQGIMAADNASLLDANEPSGLNK